MLKINGKPIHNHPHLEKEKKLDSDHVIIDRELYEELLRMTSNFLENQ